MTTKNSLEVSIGGARVSFTTATLEKYNQPGPRYTSYPTAPEWDDQFGPAELREVFSEANEKPAPAPLSLYFHIPFCESLCLYCGCNVVISKKHSVALTYLDALKREIDSTSAEVLASRKVEQLHWGGGTPTYLTPSQIEDLYTHIQKRFSFSDGAEMSVEVDPRATSNEHCRALRRVGFNRVSLGIQDFDPLFKRLFIAFSLMKIRSICSTTVAKSDLKASTLI